MAEAASTALALIERFDDVEMGLYHRYQHQLGNALANGDGERGVAAVPARHHQLALVVRVDQPDQVAQHDAVLMAQARARQDHRRQARVADVDRQAGGDQQGLAWLEDGVFLEQGAQVEAGGAGGGVCG
ncbi:hypothetical protein D3C71_1673130 [compost metagenome]